MSKWLSEILSEVQLKSASHHVLYELGMFVHCSELLPHAQILDQAIRNALVESRCVHLRNLASFFADKKHKDDVIAADFFDANGNWKNPTLSKTLKEDCTRAS